jgi:hypothetical protein
MATREADIELALFAEIEGAAFTLPIWFPNQDAPGEKPYIVVQIVRVNRRDDTLNGENTISLGRVIGTIVTPTGKGSKEATRHADAFAELFPMGKAIPVTGGQIVFTKPADIQEGFPDGADWRVPVIAQYEAS